MNTQKTNNTAAASKPRFFKRLGGTLRDAIRPEKTAHLRDKALNAGRNFGSGTESLVSDLAKTGINVLSTGVNFVRGSAAGAIGGKNIREYIPVDSETGEPIQTQQAPEAPEDADIIEDDDDDEQPVNPRTDI